MTHCGVGSSSDVNSIIYNAIIKLDTESGLGMRLCMDVRAACSIKVKVHDTKS